MNFFKSVRVGLTATIAAVSLNITQLSAEPRSADEQFFDK